MPEAGLEALGRKLLLEKDDKASSLTVVGRGLENSSRPTVILKPRQAYEAYRRMLRWYAVRGIMAFLEERPLAAFSEAAAELDAPRVSDWVNLGGQIVPAHKVDQLRTRIGEGELAAWDAIHAAYDDFADEYSLDVARHSWAVLKDLRASEGVSVLDKTAFLSELREAAAIRSYIAEQVRLTRSKDFRDPFRSMTYRNSTEMEAVLGTPDTNPFIRRNEAEAAAFAKRVEKLRERLTSS